MASYFANSDFSRARIVVTGMPLDRTSSFIPGTRFGPETGRLGTPNIESFSPYQNKDIARVPIYDTGDIEFSFATNTRPFELIAQTTRTNYQAGKKQLAVGGEHSITPHIIGELVRYFPDLYVVQFDAHSDLRQDFLGERFCHATAMQRVLDHIPREQLFQLGIRSFATAEEMKEPNLFPFELLAPAKKIVPLLGNHPLYITLDVDVLDPGVMPDVQTPQPGGCSYRELVQTLANFSGLNCIGADIVEFCPRNPSPVTTASTVAELIRELILLLS